MNYDSNPRNELQESKQSSSKGFELLKSQIQDMQHCAFSFQKRLSRESWQNAD